MPHYSIQEFNEPRFFQCESYYLTWQDDNYGNGGPYGEPISFYQDDFFYEPNTPAYPELVDFKGQFWNEYGLTDQAYRELQLPYNGDNYWLSEYESESYFDGHWKEDIWSPEDGAFDYEEQSAYNQSTYDYKQIAFNHKQTAYDYDKDEQSAYDYKSWLGNGLVLGHGINNEEGVREYEPFRGENEPHSYSWNMYEMELCDRIFVNWPPLSPTDNESFVAEAQA